MNKVWVNGCFDIVHSGHLYIFSLAKSLGEVHVGIDTDERIKKSKGDARPIFTTNERLLLLSSLKFIDHVYTFSTDVELTELVANVCPDYMLVGEEYKHKRVIGSESAKELIYVPKVGNFSTSNVEARVLSQHKDYFKFIKELVEYGNEK
jgi:D-beta-D-heptose 7-phosphate kinase/D-beta-D-heptose 1-phosphate adenosyltransferase